MQKRPPGHNGFTAQTIAAHGFAPTERPEMKEFHGLRGWWIDRATRSG